jgi:hypothetical protein
MLKLVQGPGEGALRRRAPSWAGSCASLSTRGVRVTAAAMALRVYMPRSWKTSARGAAAATATAARGNLTAYGRSRREAVTGNP